MAARRVFVLEMRFIACQTTSQNEIVAWTMMDQWWAGPQFDGSVVGGATS